MFVNLSEIRGQFPKTICNLGASYIKVGKKLSNFLTFLMWQLFYISLFTACIQAQMLHEEGQDSSLKVAQVTSGDWIVRIDDVVALLSKLRAEVKEAHAKKTNGKCYGRGVRQ